MCISEIAFYVYIYENEELHVYQTVTDVLNLITRT